ncbi:hypothetical protein J6590_104173, partial [Homalodisca vitripennis]
MLLYTCKKFETNEHAKAMHRLTHFLMSKLQTFDVRLTTLKLIEKPARVWEFHEIWIRQTHAPFRRRTKSQELSIDNTMIFQR